MAKSHYVDMLSSGFVVKTASSETHNAKLNAEIQQIKALCEIYPDLMVPVLHDGSAAGRRFYILEKKQGSPLSKIVFDSDMSFEQRRSILIHVLDAIQMAIGIERSKAHPTVSMHSRISEEWDAISFMHDLFDQHILFDGVPLGTTGRKIVENALKLAETEEFVSVETAHFNFHFGNVIYNDAYKSVQFIDPDNSVRGIDPLFGFSRFAFSFWHELATERENAVEIMKMPDNLLFISRNADYPAILAAIPELSDISGLSPWISKNDFSRFYILTTYCFLRSIRINALRENRRSLNGPQPATPEEILMLGCIAYLGRLRDIG
ncbi:MAG: hypothetical protein F8N37_12475 [Telmatospirillum sp.]|nr:hypothetical protein [Telmatospirillum sp.]